jgi:BolA protein
VTATHPADAPTAAQLAQRLRERLAPTRLEVLDESYQHNGHAGANGTGFGTHFRVRIASHLFTGLRPVARHRLVYDALQDFIDRGLHALAIEADIPPNITPA